MATAAMPADLAPWDEPLDELTKARMQKAIQKRRREQRDPSGKIIFGEVLAMLVDLGVEEKKARQMLGRWRQAYGDTPVIDAVRKAYDTGASEPISFVTGILRSIVNRGLAAQGHAVTAGGSAAPVAGGFPKRVKAFVKPADRHSGEWQFLGWEAPTLTPSGKKFRKAVRQQVWRNNHGKAVFKPPREDQIPPTLDDDPGVEIVD